MVLSVCLICLCAGFVGAWQPAAAPLMTKFSKDVHPDQVPPHPRPTMVRPSWQHLNGLWQINHTISDLTSPPFGKDLPYEILVPYPVESPLSGIRNLTTNNFLWQRRLFATPPNCNLSSERVLLHFEAVDWNATVYLNKKMLGTHAGGYDAFHFDATDAMKASSSHELLVGVYDPTGDEPHGKQSRGAFSHPGGIFYTCTSGIWQTVWMECVPPTHIVDIFNNPDLDGNGSVTVTATIASPSANMQIRVDITTNNGTQIVGTATGPATKPVRAAIKNAKDRHLWTPTTPFLYDLKVSLLDGTTVVDAVDSYFGLRVIRIANDSQGIPRPMLNGEFIFQVGTLDQGFWPDGAYTAPTDEALAYDLVVHKQLGFNTVRKHVKVEPRRWYYHADRLGLLVWQDMPSGNNNDPTMQAQFRIELERLVLGRRNHPSIVQWEIFNEGWGQASDDWMGELVDEVAGIDPYRIVDDSSGGRCAGCYGNVTDMHRYSPPGSPTPDPAKGLAALLGEFGGVLLVVDGHQWAPGKCHGYRTVNSSDDLTAVYASYVEMIAGFKTKPGLSASIYTQITDCETECNGVMTYDRIVKMNAAKTKAANDMLNSKMNS